MPTKQSLPWSRYLPAGLTLCVGVGLSLAACVLVWKWENQRRDYEFNRYADGVATSLQQNFNDDLEVIPNIGDFLAASSSVERAAFQQFARRPLSRHPNIQLLAWVPRVTDDRRYNYEQAARADGHANFEIVERDSQGQIVPARGRREYFPAYYLEPLKGNQMALGLDLASHPAFRAAMEQARSTGEMVVTKQSDLLNESDDRLGLLAIQPIFSSLERDSSSQVRATASTIPYSVTSSNLNLTENRDRPRSDEAFEIIHRERSDQLQGFVVGVFRATDIFQAALVGKGDRNLNLYLTNNTDAEGKMLRHSEGVPLYPKQEQNFLVFYDSSTGQVEKFSNSKKSLELDMTPNRNQTVGTRIIEVANRKWALYLLTTPEYREIQTKHWRSWATLIIGLLWTHIPVTYLLTSLSRQTQIEQLAADRARQAEQLQQAFKQLAEEQEKSEQLLLNILPEAIARRLKQKQQIIADSFPEVTVLFADIVGFTQLASRVSPTELVQFLNEIFSAFDRLAVQHGLEKIKTIGDAYMVVGGLPIYRLDHAHAIAEMALDMQEEMAKFDVKHGESLSMRIGIHTGPVVAGVIGTNKFIYDLWGDTVNTASRMESHGIPGCIHVSGATQELLRDNYWLENRGPISIKGKGEMTTYLLISRKVCRLPSSLMLRAQQKSRRLKELPAEGEMAIAVPSCATA